MIAVHVALIFALTIMSTNPSHILIARNSRGHNPSASISGPTETHAAALGVFRMGVEGSPPGPWLLEEVSVDNEDPLLTSEFTTSDSEGGKPIEIQEEFTRNAKFPGTVKIIVEGTTFWFVHYTIRVAQTKANSRGNVRKGT
jgi:hypothetical protein